MDNDIYNDNDTEEKTIQDGMVDNELYEAGLPNADNEAPVPDTSAVYLNLKTTATGDKIELKENDVYESASISSDQGQYSEGDPKRESLLNMVEKDVYSLLSE